MGKERLGGFEKFILTHAYLKGLGICAKYPHRYNEKMLYKTEILRGYFPDLKPSDKGEFQDTPEYRSALAQFTTAVKNLERKELIERWVKKEQETIVAVTLTEKGEEKAKTILVKNNS